MEAIAGFERARPTVAGHPVELSLTAMGSRDMYLAVLDGTEQPVLISPASSLQISILQDLSTARLGKPLVNVADRQACRPVLTTPLVHTLRTERTDLQAFEQQLGNVRPA